MSYTYRATLLGASALFAFSMLPLGSVQATSVTFDTAVLELSTTVTVDGLTLDVTAANGGVVDVYDNNAFPPNGVVIGAPANGNLNDTSGSTNPPSGDYFLNFDKALTSIEVTFGFLTNRPGAADEPPETISLFAADGIGILDADIGFANILGTSFDSGIIVADDGVGNGQGIFTYTGSPFNALSFRHLQNPGNIGFVISNVEATLAPVPLPAALPLFAGGLGLLGLLGWRRKRKTTPA